MSKVTVVAKLVAREEAVDTVKAEVLKMAEPTRQEPGCIEYRLHQDNEDPTVFLFYENWENLACLEQHMRTTHFRSYVAAVGGSALRKGLQQDDVKRLIPRIRHVRDAFQQ